MKTAATNFHPILSTSTAGGPEETAGTASTSSRPSAHAANPALDGLRAKARTVYEAERRFHGTNETSARAIRSSGFEMSAKAQTMGISGNAMHEESKQHHYLTGSKPTAKGFAKLATSPYDPSAKPGLVRAIGAHTNKHTRFEADPFKTHCSDIRTKDDIKGKHVLLGKCDRPGKDAEVFQRRLKKAGIKVDLSIAGKLLREVQSDDEGDFL